MTDVKQPDDVLARFVAGLAAAGGGRAPVNDPADLAAAGEGLPATAIGWAVAVAHRCGDTVTAMMGEHLGKLPETEVRRAVETEVLWLLRRLAGQPRRSYLNADQVFLAQQMARLGFAYERFMAGLRAVQAIVLDALLDQAARYQPAAGRRALLRAVPGAVTAYYDESVSAVVAEYLTERQRAIGQSVADQRSVVAALIAGRAVLPDAVSRTLGIDLDRHHLALVLWAQDEAGEAPAVAALRLQSKLHRSAARAADALRAPAPLVIQDDADRYCMLCWITRRAPFPADYDSVLRELLAPADDVRPAGGAGAAAGQVRVTAGAPAPGLVRVAVGVPAHGAAGFRRTYLAARDAHRLASHGLPGAVTAYRDAGVATLLTSDPERARWFVTEELGELACAADGTIRDLRATALCYLESGCSVVRTAQALHMHRNTVVYRLNSVERLLGHAIGERPLATHAALTLADRLGGSLFALDAAGSAPASGADPGRDLLEDATYLLGG